MSNEIGVKFFINLGIPNFIFALNKIIVSAMWFYVFGFLLSGLTVVSQSLTVAGRVTDGVVPLGGVTIHDMATGSTLGSSNSDGKFLIKLVFDKSSQNLILSFTKNGFQNQEIELQPWLFDSTWLEVILPHKGHNLSEVVVTGSLMPVERAHSTVPVSVLNSLIFRRLSTPQLMEALPVLPGVRLHNECNVCEAPGVRFNGLPGPYTLVVIDGMPMMGALASTYGLYALPSGILQRVEVVRGPGSVLYGTEAMGGVINILTVSPDVAPKVSAEQLLTTWGEVTSQFTTAYRVGKLKMQTGFYHHHYSNRIDRNSDDFMDLPLQKRVSVYQKIRYSDVIDVWLRYYYEDRLGGSMRGQHSHRYTFDEYVESIFTNRAEWLMKFSPKQIKPLQFWWGASGHWQNSVYGEDQFNAQQRLITFQTLWQKSNDKLQYTLGSALRYQYYNDNTTATTLYIETDSETDAPDRFWMPALFFDAALPAGNVLFSTSGRLDYHPVHGVVPTGRIGGMYRFGRHTFRASHGSAFRIVNLFAEEHAALSGAREVVVRSNLRPERVTGQYAEWEFIHLKPQYYIKTTTGLFNNTFTNRILPDYDTDPQKIIFDNLEGKLSHKGINVQIEWGFDGKWDFSVGAALQDMKLIENDRLELPPFVERMNFQNLIGYSFGKSRFDLSSFTYSPMRLPLAGELDPRPEFSPWFTHLHLQYSYRSEHGYSLSFGVKNLLDFVPWRGLPFLIARADDPFDERVQFDAEGVPVPTADNPYALTFDPSYAYTSLQGRRFFIQWTFKL